MKTNYAILQHTRVIYKVLGLGLSRLHFFTYVSDIYNNDNITYVKKSCEISVKYLYSYSYIEFYKQCVDTARSSYDVT